MFHCRVGLMLEIGLVFMVRSFHCCEIGEPRVIWSMYLWYQFHHNTGRGFLSANLIYEVWFVAFEWKTWSFSFWIALDVLIMRKESKLQAVFNKLNVIMLINLLSAFAFTIKKWKSHFDSSVCYLIWNNHTFFGDTNAQGGIRWGWEVMIPWNAVGTKLRQGSLSFLMSSMNFMSSDWRQRMSSNLSNRWIRHFLIEIRWSSAQ